jgi:hypothetical protein
MIICAFMQCLFLAYVAKEFIQTNFGYNFPLLNLIIENIQSKTTKWSYHVFYLAINNYSKSQIMYNKWIKPLFPKEEKEEIHAFSIDFCKNGEIVESVIINNKLTDAVSCEHIKCEISDYDFVVVTDDLHRVQNVPSNKIWLKDKNELATQLEKSNIKFLSFDLHYNDKVYDIKLHNDKESFYTVNNKINKDFLKFQLKQMGADVSEDFNYKITIIDHDVNVVEVDDTQEIVIEKDGYQIQKTNININNNNEKDFNINKEQLNLKRVKQKQTI